MLYLETLTSLISTGWFQERIDQLYTQYTRVYSLAVVTKTVISPQVRVHQHASTSLY